MGINESDNRSYLLEVIANKDKEMLALAEKLSSLEEEMESYQGNVCVADEVKTALSNVLKESLEIKSIINDFTVSYGRLDSALKTLINNLDENLGKESKTMENGLNIAYDYYVLRVPVPEIVKKYELKSQSSVRNYNHKIKKMILEEPERWSPGSKAYAILCNIDSRNKRAEKSEDCCENTENTPEVKEVCENTSKEISKEEPISDEVVSAEVDASNDQEEESIVSEEVSIENDSDSMELEDSQESEMQEKVKEFLFEWTEAEVLKYFIQGYSIDELASIFDVDCDLMLNVLKTFEWFEEMDSTKYDSIMCSDAKKYGNPKNISKEFKVNDTMAKYIAAAWCRKNY